MSSTSRVRVATSLAALIIVPALVAAVIHAQAAPSSSPVQRMHEHLTSLNNVEYAVVRGDLDDVREMSKILLNEASMDGLPTDAQKYLGDLKGAARQAGDAATLEEAAKAVATMTATCGTCHTGLGTPITMTAPVKPPTVAAVRARMLEHYYSVEMMGLGLQAPSDELWKRGAETMRAAQVMSVKLADETLTADINAAEAKFKEIGAAALAAGTPAERAKVYGHVLASCGSCHSLHGRVFGPGVPKL